MKAIFTSLFIIISLFSFSQVRISQVYGGGGNSALSTYDHDFVEIFNAGTSVADISNWSIQYASAAGPVAPGDWAVASIPAATTIAAGKYFLVELATGGANGIALPTPDLINTTINISNTAGKVALVNNSTPLNGTTACSGASVIDVIGYGAAATCFETAFAVTAGIDNTMSQLRGSNGCDETNNNSNDFSIGAVNPRNSASAANACGAASALLNANPNSLTIFTSVGIPSIEQTYTLSGSNLTGFPGNIAVTASAGLQVSLTSGSGFAGSVNVPYGSATLANTTIYVRISAVAPQGVLSGTITNSGGGAANAIVTINGGVYQDFYNTKADNGLNDVSTWSTTTDGTGPSPADFTSAFQVFNIIDEINADYTGVWNVTGAGGSSRVVVGNGSTPLTFTVLPGADSLTMATKVDVLNQGTLVLRNNRRPFLNNLAQGSTVDFAQTGITSSDTIRIPNISFYNLILTGGLKYFSPAVTTIRGILVADGVQSMNGSAPNFSTINALGDVEFLNGAQFEGLPSGDAARITLAMNGNGIQNIHAGVGSIINLFRLQRDSINTNSVINLNARMVLGNSAGGGLRLNQGPSTTTVLNIPQGSFAYGFSIVGAGIVTPAAQGRINSNWGMIRIAKTAGNSNAGILRFVPGAFLGTLDLDFGAGFTRDSIMIADSVLVNGLVLTKGRAVLFPPALLTVGPDPINFVTTGAIIGGSSSSFVDGKLLRTGFIDPTNCIYPLGKADKYAPVFIRNPVMPGGTSMEYFFDGYGDYTIDPATLSSFPDYNVSVHEYWVIEQLIAFNLDLEFHYTDGRSGILDPTQVKIAHFDGTDWNDLGGTDDAANTTTNGFVTVNSVSTFSPFTFSARTTGVLPVRLTSFTAQKQDKVVKLNWSTSQEINSSYFIVQRSTDGRTWKDIATVAAAGNSNTKQNYSTIDNSPVNGMNFYRLKQVDINGKSDLSETRTVLFSTVFAVSINPNPATDFVNVFISKDNNNASTIIFTDMNGRQMNKFITGETNYKINVNQFAPGIYFVRVINDGNELVKKLVIY